MEHENISYEKLVDLIKAIGQRAKKPFKDALNVVGKSILGAEPNYYDDFYFFRNKIYSDIDDSFSSIEPVVEVQGILTDMEFDLSKIGFVFVTFYAANSLMKLEYWKENFQGKWNYVKRKTKA